MAKKLISYDDEAEGLGLPDAVEEGLNATYATQAVEKAVPLAPITTAPTVHTGRTLLGVVGGDLWAADSSTQLVRLVGDTWTPAATLPAGTSPRRIQPLGNGEVIVNRDMSLWLSSGFANPATATFSKVLEIPAANQPDTRFHQGWGVDVVGTQVIATEYGVHGKSRYAWYSNDSGVSFDRVFDLHDWPGGTTSGIGGAHMHGVAINPYDGTLFAIAGDAAASTMFWAEASSPTVWQPIPGQPLKSGVKIIPTVAKAFPWGTLLASDDTPNGNWFIPHSPSRNYRVEYTLVKRWGVGNNTVVGEHIFDDNGTSWSLFGDGGPGYPGFITAGSSSGTQSIVWEDASRHYFVESAAHLVFAHGHHVYVSRGNGSYLRFDRPTYGAANGAVEDTGWVLGGEAHPSQQAVAIGFGSKAVALRSIAIGESATTDGNAATAIGRRSVASVANSIAIGGNATDDPLRDVVATAVNAIAIGYGATAQGVAIGTLSSAGQTSATAIGPSATSPGSSSVAVGHQSTTSGSNSVAVGYGVVSSGVAIGSSAVAGFSTSTALGYRAESEAASSVALGAETSTTGANAIAIGRSASATVSRATAIGQGATASNAGSVALGQGTATTVGDQVNIGPRHIEGNIVASEPGEPASGAGRLYFFNNGGTVELRVRTSAGVRRVQLETL